MGGGLQKAAVPAAVRPTINNKSNLWKELNRGVCQVDLNPCLQAFANLQGGSAVIGSERRAARGWGHAWLPQPASHLHTAHTHSWGDRGQTAREEDAHSTPRGSSEGYARNGETLALYNWERNQEG